MTKKLPLHLTKAEAGDLMRAISARLKQIDQLRAERFNVEGAAFNASVEIMELRDLAQRLAHLSNRLEA
jgi:hypothetical protein